MTLNGFFNNNPRCALGFSGGVDSAYLLYYAYKNDVDIKPYFVKSDFQTEKECIEAAALAESFGYELTIINVDVMANDAVRFNDNMRCYYCKKQIFSAIIEHASADGYSVVLEGTNMSDDIDDRPGYKAIRELGIISPLRECGITKDMIRAELKAADVDVWNKPSSACLATRIPCGTEITSEDLRRVEKAEEILSDLGFSDFRVRFFGKTAKIQLNEKQFLLAAEKRRDIVNGLCGMFDDILLDLKER